MGELHHKPGKLSFDFHADEIADVLDVSAPVIVKLQLSGGILSCGWPLLDVSSPGLSGGEH